MKRSPLFLAVLLGGVLLAGSGCTTTWCLKADGTLVPVSVFSDPEVVEGLLGCTLPDVLPPEPDTRTFGNCTVRGERPRCPGCTRVEQNGSFERGLAQWGSGFFARDTTEAEGALACTGDHMLLVPRPDDQQPALQAIGLADLDLPSPARVQVSVLVNRAGTAPGPPFTLGLDIRRTPNATLGFSQSLDADADPETWEVLTMEYFLPDDATELVVYLGSGGDFSADHDYLFDAVEVAIGPTPLYDLQVEKRALNAEGQPIDTLTAGELLVYEVVVTNGGPEATPTPLSTEPFGADRIVLEDVLPAALSSATPGLIEGLPTVTQGAYRFDEATRTLQWALTPLAPGDSATLRLIVRPDAPATLLNTARVVTGLGGDTDIANNSDATRTVVEPAANRRPVAVNDEATTEQGVPVTIDVLANDSDPDGDPITVLGTGQPTNGSVAVVDEGQAVQYTPVSGFVGTESFGYVIQDDRGGFSNEAIVTVTVGAANRPPVVAVPLPDIAVSVDPESSCTFDLDDHFEDPDGDALTYAFAQSSEAAEVDLDGTSLTVTGAFFGTVSVTVTAQDPGGLTASDAFTVDAALTADCGGGGTAP